MHAYPGLGLGRNPSLSSTEHNAFSSSSRVASEGSPPSALPFLQTHSISPDLLRTPLRLCPSLFSAPLPPPSLSLPLLLASVVSGSRSLCSVLFLARVLSLYLSLCSVRKGWVQLQASNGVHVLYLSTTDLESGAHGPRSYHVSPAPSSPHPNSGDGSWSTMVTSPSASKPVPGVPFLSALVSTVQSLPTLPRRDLDSRLASPPLCRHPPLSPFPHICARALESV
jgi:hypothetical protein